MGHGGGDVEVQDVEVKARIVQGRLPSPIPVRRPRGRSRLVRVALVGSGVLAAGAVVAALAVRRPLAQPELLTQRAEAALVLYVDTPAGSRRLADGDEVHAGERLRFEVRAAHAGHMAIVGVDGHGATVYHPFASAAPVLYDPARPVVPGAVAVGEAPGVERIYLLYARAPFSVQAATQALLAGAPPPPGVSGASVYVVRAP